MVTKISLSYRKSALENFKKRILRRVEAEQRIDQGRQEEEITKDNTDIFACLSAEEQKSFGDYLDHVISALESEFDTNDEWDDMNDWMKTARERMGDEPFERLMSMRRGFGGMWGGGRQGGRGFAHNHRHHHHGSGPDRREEGREDGEEQEI